MLLISKEIIQKNFSMEDAIFACEKALSIYRNNNANIPDRMHLNSADNSGVHLYMPALTKGNFLSSGIKVVSVFPNNQAKHLPNVPAIFLLLDAETGVAKAILDGTYLTSLRTGAVQGVATKYLSNPNSKVASLIGVGGQALNQALAMLTVRNINLLKIYSPTKSKVIEFKNILENKLKELNNQYSVTVEVCDTVNSCIDGSDIITTVTNSKTPTFDTKHIKSGAHINGIGSYRPDMIELPKEIFKMASNVVYDTNAGVLDEAGDVLLAIKEGYLSSQTPTFELSQIIANPQLIKSTNLSNSKAITVFKSVGSALFDVVTAEMIYQKVKEKNMGFKFKLDD